MANEQKDHRQALFDLLVQEHGVHATETEMNDIEHVVLARYRDGVNPVIQITDCYACPHHFSRFAGRKRGYIHTCQPGSEKREIPNATVIPAWCPLREGKIHGND